MSIETIHALEAYVGTPYELGVYDCMDLVQQVQREVFERDVQLPADRHRPLGAAAQRREISSLREEIAVRVNVPFDGCAALLIEPGLGAQIWHVGVVGLLAGESWVLHNSHALGGAHLHRLKDLQRWGMQLEGYYAWK